VLHFFYAFTTPSTQNLTGVGIAPSEIDTAGALSEGGGPLENLIGVGIAPSDAVGTGILSLGPGAAQGLIGIGIGPSEVDSAGTLIVAGANSLNLMGVAIAPAEVLHAGILLVPGSLSQPPAQPGFLTDAQLASLQGTVQRSLPWFATVLTDTQTKDADDDQTDSWLPTAVYNCDIEFMDPQEEVTVGGQLQAVGGYLVTLPWNAVVDPKQRLQISSPYGQGVLYEIRNDQYNWTDQSAVYVIVEEVR
jgi:hypothetical protein